MAVKSRPRAALAARALLLAAAVTLCAAAGPLKVPTARPGECWDKMLGELQASDRPGKVRKSEGNGWGGVLRSLCRHRLTPRPAAAAILNPTATPHLPSITGLRPDLLRRQHH